MEVESSLKNKHLITTETVLIELLNYLAEFPPQMLEAVAKFTKLVLDGDALEVVFHTYTTLFCKVWNFTKIGLIKVIA